MLSYIIRYKKELKGNAKFWLITYESKEYYIRKIERSKVKENLKKHDIIWYPLRYHSGRLILLKKLIDFINGCLTSIYLNFKIQFDLIYTVGTISGSFGFVLSKILNAELLVHTYEPHSEFMADFGIWNRKSMPFKLLNRFEKIIGIKSNYIMTGTDAMIRRLKERNSKASIFKVPSCVDMDKFRPIPEIRKKLRSELKFEGKSVLLYMGKFGGIYFEHEAFMCFQAFLDLKSEDFDPQILILSPTDEKWIKSMADKWDLKESEYTTLHVSFDVVQNYINVGDIGFCGITPHPSQRYRSPIKNGEYLACGIPYIVPEGISEDDKIALKNNVGIVLKNLEPDSIILAMKSAREFLLKQNPKELSQRCRDTARTNRGISNVDDYYLQIFG